MAKSTPFFTSLKDLFAFLELPEPSTQVANSRFSFFVSRHFASKMEKGNPNDPLLREILPTEEENRIVEEGTKIEQKIKDKELYLPSEETERKMYWKVKQKLEESRIYSL